MSTTAVVPSSSTVSFLAVQDIPLSSIRESKTNPRRQFDETKLGELADNIRLHGVLQPILLRPRIEPVFVSENLCLENRTLP